VWPTAHLLHWQHYVRISCFVFLLTALEARSAFAQGTLPAPANGTALATIAQDLHLAALSEHEDEPDGSQTTNTLASTANRPPLPFQGPQIGPQIRHVAMDNIERRTTAFIPQSLDHLTAVEMPDEEKWIRVDLSEQIVVAYEKGKPIRAFVISSGLPGTPTVTGEFRIRMKVREQTMSGGQGSMYYNLPGVKWVQYFHRDYGFHGTYWHSNFGQPMSHGCINMTDTDAKWLFDWAGPVWDDETVWYPSTTDNPGTLVTVTE
jgi:lipoprotein-anchoring transpeptidase ErfK/SrfK